MADKEYKSRIEEPEVHTTSNGGSYVTPFDVVRSTAGRELIRKHAEMAVSLGLEKRVNSNGAPKASSAKTARK